jgi:hypothetical protein
MKERLVGARGEEGESFSTRSVEERIMSFGVVNWS